MILVVESDSSKCQRCNRSITSHTKKDLEHCETILELEAVKVLLAAQSVTITTQGEKIEGLNTRLKEDIGIGRIWQWFVVGLSIIAVAGIIGIYVVLILLNIVK